VGPLEVQVTAMIILVLVVLGPITAMHVVGRLMGKKQ
jgi:hypothetical protein